MQRLQAPARALRLFLAVTLGLSVLHWTIFHFARRAGWEPPSFLFGVLRSYGPAIGAVVALGLTRGRVGLRDLWSRVTRWRVPARYYAFAILGPMAVLGAMFVVSNLLVPELVVPQRANWIKLLALFFVLILLDGPLGEEIGWRGFLQPALGEQMGPVATSLLIGAIWYLWHIPLYLADGRDMTPEFHLRYLILCLALALMHTWLFQRSGGSAWLSVLFHNATNYVVLLSREVFPRLGETQIDNDTYWWAMVLGGLLTWWSLRRRGRKK